MVKIKEWNYPGNRCRPSHFKALIIGSDKVITDWSCPGRCDNSSLHLDAEGIIYNASSHGTISFSYEDNEGDRYEVIVSVRSSLIQS